MKKVPGNIEKKKEVYSSFKDKTFRERVEKEREIYPIKKGKEFHPIIKEEEVYLKLTTQPLFVGSYIKVPVIIKPGSAINFEDSDFEIPAGVQRLALFRFREMRSLI